MKRKLLTLLLSIAALYGTAYAELPEPDVSSLLEPRSICPITLRGDSCMSCHVMREVEGVPKFGLKEVRPDSWREYPNGFTSIKNGKGYFYQDNIDSDLFKEAVEYLADKHKIKHIIVEINNPGGGSIRGVAHGGADERVRKQGRYLRNRCYGYGMSAGFIMLVGGTRGHRFVSPTATLMWHELMSFAFLKIETPSSKEQEASIMRGLQDTINTWLSCRSLVPKDAIDAKIKHVEWWMSGKEAIDLGFADGVIK